MASPFCSQASAESIQGREIQRRGFRGGGEKMEADEGALLGLSGIQSPLQC